jgi:hypothetical protein
MLNSLLIIHNYVVERVNNNMAMATSKPRTSSFSRNLTAVPSPSTPGLKYGPNGTIFISSGIPDLDSNSLHYIYYFLGISYSLIDCSS